NAGGSHDIVAIGFDGSARRMVGSYGGGHSNWGVSDDGKLVVANYHLWRTDGTAGFDLAVQGGAFSGDPPGGIDLFMGVPSGKVDRVMYIDTGPNPRRVATLEINPATTAPAPAISEPTINPPRVPTDGSTAATVTVKVDSPGGKLVRVAAAVMKDGV